MESPSVREEAWDPQRCGAERIDHLVHLLPDRDHILDPQRNRLLPESHAELASKLLEWKIQRGRTKDTKKHMNELKNWTKDPRLSPKNLTLTFCGDCSCMD